MACGVVIVKFDLSCSSIAVTMNHCVCVYPQSMSMLEMVGVMNGLRPTPRAIQAKTIHPPSVPTYAPWNQIARDSLLKMEVIRRMVRDTATCILLNVP